MKKYIKLALFGTLLTFILTGCGNEKNIKESNKSVIEGIEAENSYNIILKQIIQSQ